MRLLILNFGRNNALVQWCPIENCTLEVFCELPCILSKFNEKMTVFNVDPPKNCGPSSAASITEEYFNQNTFCNS